jgi:ligand-binding sensor protein
LIRTAPRFAFKIVNEYIYAYSSGLIDNIVPLEIKKLRTIISEQIGIEKELIEAYIRMENDQRETVKGFFNEIG